ncbi:hypothetical protein [Clostridium sp.]|mgnify:CR=1 FL=1|uniref:hypothetical protein n=1 Tax=Clostridium sp. TaxID=1506 RepID=UPI002900D451|nr:hypothetical protein [Clostridium sp.]MDU1968983.1 hypothetical protein [Clostridium perfringens]MDU1823979.1 hypothetical protein [Clostridium sp.]MDU1841034.1 hypothetical protein [Clostridium sp.]MDU2691413.1 hypothetical protein [Clostridium sp.]MDU2957272.1 hypothetical protein [Clostridium sp.]
MNKQELIRIYNLYILQENNKKEFNTNYLEQELPKEDLTEILVNNFNEIQYLILSNPNYPIFQLCSEKHPIIYSRYFSLNFNKSNLQYILSNFLGTLFCRYKTTNFNEIIDYYVYDSDKNPLNTDMMKLNTLISMRHFDLNFLNQIISIAINIFKTYEAEITLCEDLQLKNSIDLFMEVTTEQCKIDILNTLRNSFKLINSENDKKLMLHLLEELKVYSASNDPNFIDEIDSLIIEFNYLFKN